MRVVVVGAGIGGLTLAQALRRAGTEVSVHDRDPAVEATGGYRLHLDAGACGALARHLSPAHYQALLASSAGPVGLRQFTLADHRMRVLAAEPRDPADETLMIGRVPLRRLLAHGLDDALHFGSEFRSFAHDADGSVVACFADGTTDRGDVLVGADGAHSRVAAALAGAPTSRPTGFSGITGRTPLTDGIGRQVPDVLRRGPVLAFGPDGVALFATLHEPGRSPVDPATCVEVPARTEDPVIVWGPLAAEDRFPADVRERSGTGLVEASLDLLTGWAPPVRALVAAADPASPASYRFHAADPDADLTPWPAGRVTALGDAVHAMPPTAGRAAATAIRDADLLAGELTRAEVGTVPLAIHRYHRAMAPGGAAAVRASLEPLRRQALAQRWLGRRGMALALPAAAVLAGLRVPAHRRSSGVGHAV